MVKPIKDPADLFAHMMMHTVDFDLIPLDIDEIDYGDCEYCGQRLLFKRPES